jgi:hypothetical protein
MDQRAARRLNTLWRLAQVHGQRAFQHNERLFLMGMPMAPSLRARLIPPNVGARIREPGDLTEFGNVPGGLVVRVRPRDPLELIW